MIWKILIVISLIISCWSAFGVHFNTKTCELILKEIEIIREVIFGK